MATEGLLGKEQPACQELEGCPLAGLTVCESVAWANSSVPSGGMNFSTATLVLEETKKKYTSDNVIHFLCGFVFWAKTTPVIRSNDIILLDDSL